MILFVNTNKYLGGGETFVIRMLSYRKDSCALCAEEGFIYQKINNEQAILPNNMNKVELEQFSSVYFLNFRDFLKYQKLFVSKQITLNYYNLHVFDFLYHSFDYKKMLLSFLKGRIIKSYTKKNLVYFRNKSLLERRINGKVFFMNEFALNFYNDLKCNKDVIPLPSVEIKGINKLIEKRNNYNIIWIGRLVDFKTPSLVKMINFVKKSINYKLTIVGYGLDQKIVESEIGKCDRILFKEKVLPEDLGKVISKNSIGFAMGTSVVEIASYGIPCIVAQPFYENNGFTGCLGHFSELGYGDFGESGITGVKKGKNLEACLSGLETKYSIYAKESFLKTKEFSFNNFNKFE